MKLNIFEKFTNHKENISNIPKKEETVDDLLDDFNEVKKELENKKNELDIMMVDLSDSENRTELQLNNPEKAAKLQSEITQLNATLEVIKQKLDEIQK